MNVSELLGTPTERTADEAELQSPVGNYDPDERPSCSEPGCERPCRKRRNSDDYFPYCAQHNAQHQGTGRPKSQGVHELETKRKKQAQEITEKLNGIGQAIQFGLIGSGDLYCAKAIGEEWEPMAKVAGDLSVEFKWVREGVEAVDKWGSIAVLVYHMVRLGATIGVHHGLIPYEGPVKLIAPNPNLANQMTVEGATVANGNGSPL